MAQAPMVTEQAEQTLRVSLAFEKEVMSRAARRNKPLFQEVLLERRATMEVAYARAPWDARKMEIIKQTESYLEQRDRVRVGIEELEDDLLSSVYEMCIATLEELALDEEGGYHRFVVYENLWGEEVADAARFAEQARKVSAYKVGVETRKKILELQDAIAASRAENCIQGPRKRQSYAKQY